MAYALIDANNFYASCERIFRPDLRNKPIVVLSNNDGCLIARSAEAKALGYKMGTPYFKVKNQLRLQGVSVFSSNYALYADLSQRLMQTIATLAPATEIYSIDECFVATNGLSSLEELGIGWRQTIQQWTGLTVGIGFAPTKTLAKLANYAAKKYPATGGVVDLSDPKRQQRLMTITPVNEVWGVGSRLTKHLNQYKIKSAWDLAQCDQQWLKKRFSVVLARTAAELNGQSCLKLEEVRPTKQQIISSRSFGQAITNKQDLREAVIEYTARAAEKLRLEKQEAQVITVFVQNSAFGGEPHYSNSRTHYLEEATNDTRDFANAAANLLDAIYKPDIRYKKAGVMLSCFSSPHNQQLTLFKEHDLYQDHKLMQVIDNLNQAKRHDVFLAGQGVNRQWAMRRDYLSPAYTTRWQDIPIV